jgi:DNA-binding NarL/FixJ family response regulator
MQQRKTKSHAARASNTRRNTRGKKRPDKRTGYGSKKSLTQNPDDVSGRSPTKAKVLVVHRIGFVRSGVLSLIAKSLQFTTCGETDEAPSARELFVRHHPSVAVVGIILRGGDGIQLIKEFHHLNPAVALIALAEHPDALSVQRAFRAGGRGYLGIDDAPELLSALTQISAGYSYVGASVLPLILDNFAARKKASRDSNMSILSDRELEIFSFIGRGVSVSELASELHVSVKTIETHQMRMKEKLALHTAAELRQKAREWLAKSAVNRIREDPELAYAARSASGSLGE